MRLGDAVSEFRDEGSLKDDEHMKRAYFRCTSGHFFAQEYCPLDGWTSDGVREMLRAVEQLRGEGRGLSIDVLHGRGISQAALARTVVIDFGSAASVFDVMAPRGYGIDGTFRDIVELGPDFN